MSQSITVEKASLWREALPAIKMMLEAKWPWVVGLALIIAAGQILTFAYAPSADIAAQLKANPNLFKEHPELAPHWTLIGPLVSLIGFFLTLIAYYIFPIFYLQRAAKASPPKPTVGGFFYWLWKSIQKNLLWILTIFLFELGVGVGVGFFWLVFHMLKLPTTAIAPIVVIGVICFLALSFNFYFRLYLVTPLAILRKTPVIKNSRELTENHCWRIFCGAFVLVVMFGGIFLIPIIALLGIQIHEWMGALPKNGIPNTASINTGLMLSLGLLQSCIAPILAMTGAVYECTVYRILLQERKNNSTLITPQPGV